MKNSIFAAILLLPGLFFAQSQNNTIKVSLNETTFGFAYPDCQRAGPFCEIFPDDKSQTNSNIIAYRGQDNLLVIEINKDFFTHEKQLAIMGKLLKDVRENEEVKTRIEIDIPLSVEVLRALNIYEHLNTIKAGYYPIEIAEKQIVMKLELISN